MNISEDNKSSAFFFKQTDEKNTTQEVLQMIWNPKSL